MVYSGAMRIFLTGGAGVLGRALLPLLRDAGHEIAAATRTELDLLANPDAVRSAAIGAGAIYHLASRIPPRERWDDRDAWRENDRLRRDVSRLLVDAALDGDTETYVQPTVAIAGDVPAVLESALVAESETERFAAAGRRGVVLRLGALDGPGTLHERRSRTRRPRSTSRTPGGRSSRRSPSRAAPTTSPATASGSRTRGSAA